MRWRSPRWPPEAGSPPCCVPPWGYRTSKYRSALPSPLVAPRAGVKLSNGSVRELEVDRWLDDADAVDLRILERVRGPVLDVGCGPGRHVEALTQRGIDVLGMDLIPDFVAVAQRSQ